MGGWGVEVGDGDCGGHDRPEGALRGASGGGQRAEQLHTGLLLKLVIERDALVQLVKLFKKYSFYCRVCENY